MKSRTHCSVRSLFATSLTGLAALALFLAPGRASATAYTWAVTGTASWETAASWNPASVPSAATDTVAVGGSAATTLNLGADHTIAALAVTNTASTTFAATTAARSLTVTSNIVLNTSVTFGSSTSANNVNLLLGSNTFTLTAADVTFYGSNTMSGAVIKGGAVFLRNANGFGTSGTVQLGDSTANAAAVSLRTTSVTLARPIVISAGTTGAILIDNLGAGANPTYSGGITGTIGGTLTLQSTISSSSGSATFSGGSINPSGALTLKNSGAGTVATTTGTLTISSVIGTNVTGVTVQDTTSGTRGVQKVVLSGTNTYPGDTTISSGLLQLGSGTTIPDGSGKGNVTVNGTLDMNTFSETINGLSGTGTIDKTVATNTSTLTIGGNNATSAYTGTIKNTAGTLALVKTGLGTTSIGGTSTYTGTTTVNTSTGPLVFAKRTALYNATPASWTATNLIVNSGSILGFNAGGTGEFTSSDLDSLAAVGTSTGGFKTGALMGIDTTNAGGTFTYASNLANPNAGANVFGITKLGAGTLSLSGSSTFTGGVGVRQGTLLIGSANALGSGGTLNIGYTTAGSALIDGAFTVANPIQLGANPVSGTNIFGGNADATSTASGAIFLAGNATISQAATTGTNALNLTGTIGTNNPGTYTATFAGPGAINVSGAITNGSVGALAVNVTGGNVTFSGANTNSGGTTVTSGTLTTTGPGVLPDTGDVKLITGAVLNLNHNGTDRIQYLFIDGAQQANGTWGAIGSGAQHTTSLITGTGILFTGPITYLWNSTGGNGLLSSAGNWDVNLTPADSSILTFGPGPFDTALTNDLAAGTLINRLRFLSGASAYTLTGSNNIVLTGGVDNLSGNVQTLNFPMTLGGSPVTVNTSGANVVLGGVLSGTGGLTKLGGNTLELDGTNTYTGATTINAGTLFAASAGAIPSSSVLAFSNTTGPASVNLSGLTQTVANLTFGTQTTGTNEVTIGGDSTTSLTTSPAVLTFATAAANGSSLSVNMSSLGAFTYNNSAGAINLQVGNSANTGTITVTLAGGTNTLTAASLNLAGIGGGSGSSNGNLATLYLGFANTLNVNSLSLGSSFSRSTGAMKFAPSAPMASTLKIRDATGTGAAALVIGRNSSFSGDSVVYGGTLDTTGTALSGNLDALFSTIVIGNAHSDATSTSGARQVNSTGTFNMGAGTLTAASATIGYLDGSTPTVASTFTASGLLSLTAGGTATIGTITLANDTIGAVAGGTYKISGQITLDGSGATTTLNATTIQKGTVLAGENSRTVAINWKDGTIGNISTGDLTISGVPILLSGANVGSHVFNVTAGHTTTVDSVISSGDSGPNALDKTGPGTLILSGVNSYTSDTTVSGGTLSITHPCLSDTAGLIIASGAKVDLNFPSASNMVAVLIIDGVSMTADGSTYGATGSGATHIDNVHFSGTGRIQVGAAPDPFPAWAAGFGLSGTDADKASDPDHDGRSNLMEFALDGNPASGTDDGKMRTTVANVAGDTTLTLTLPVRTGVVFSGPGDLTGTADNGTIGYKIQGSTDLGDFTSATVTEVTPALSGGMPALDAGWEYRTFRLPGTVTTNPRGFLRAFVTDTP